MTASNIVALLLDSEPDEHVKAYERVQKWDNVQKSYRHLAGLKNQAVAIFRELGQGYAIERELANLGMTRADVANYLYGDRIGEIHNYKRMPREKLRRDLAKHIVGVETKDGRYRWFDNPVPPKTHDWAER